MKSKRIRVLASVVMLALVAVACGDDSDDTPAAQGNSTAVDEATTTTGAPTAGGTLTVGVLSETRGLDPIVSSGTGSTGGIELAAIYDTLLRYNPDTRDYEMRTAKSLEPNDDFTVWTLELRDGITFGDGTAYDAAAVKFNLERLKSPQSASGLRGAAANVTGVRVVDPLTVEITLNEPWSGFPYLLAGAGGMIVSPTAVQTLGQGFAASPTGGGAGPFEFVSFRPKEAIVLKRNPNYWGGDVYLDELRFVFIGAPATTYEALSSGQVQAAVFRDAEMVSKVDDDDELGMFVTTQHAGTLLAMNNGITLACNGGQPAHLCAGKPDGTQVTTPTPTSDVRVRRAIAAAIDPEVVNERAFGGHAEATSAVFGPGFPWAGDVEGPAYDPAEARRLLDDAKADGYDGRIRLIGDNLPASVAWTQAVETMLEAVGFDVDSNTTVDVPTKVGAVVAQRDFDLVATWSWAITPDDGAAVYIQNNLGSNNRYGYKSAEMDGYIREFKAATTDDARTAAAKKIAELYETDVPGLSVTQVPEAVAWSDKVQGVTPTGSSIVLFDKAFLSDGAAS